jgi:hypothetical protein
VEIGEAKAFSELCLLICHFGGGVCLEEGTSDWVERSGGGGNVFESLE